MYINDIHILYYVLFGFIGMIIGQFTDWCVIRLSEYKKVISKDFFKIYLKKLTPKYILMFINASLFIALLYTYGLSDIKTYTYMILAPMLITVILIDYKKQIIPNRLTLTIFELGLIFSFVQGISNLNIAIDSCLGMIVGTGIFLFITLIGALISGKEAIGFGDVKLVGALGLFFGWRSIIAISIISFLVGSIFSIILLLIKKKKTDEYIPFGPFIVISSFIIIFVPFEILLGVVASAIALIKK